MVERELQTNKPVTLKAKHLRIQLTKTHEGVIVDVYDSTQPIENEMIDTMGVLFTDSEEN